MLTDTDRRYLSSIARGDMSVQGEIDFWLGIIEALPEAQQDRIGRVVAALEGIKIAQRTV